MPPANSRSGFNNQSKQPIINNQVSNPVPQKTTTTSVVNATKNAVVISPRQRGNPIIPFIKAVPWEYGDIVPDYVVGLQTGILYLSLRYHRLHPEYLHQRIEKLGNMYALRVVLIMCDVNDHQDPIREISKICIINNLTVMVAWTAEEAAQYIATYKLYETKPPTMLQERTNKDYGSHLNKALTAVKGVNKTDVLTLSSSFGSFTKMVHATREEISLCPGLGDVKVRRLVEAFTAPLRGGSKRKKGVGEGEGSVESALKKKRAEEPQGEGEGEGKAKERSLSPNWPSDPEEEEVNDNGSSNPTSKRSTESAENPSRAFSPDWLEEEEVCVLKDALAEGPTAS